MTWLKTMNICAEKYTIIYKKQFIKVILIQTLTNNTVSSLKLNQLI